ncbi:zinc knuckle-domain-containing protein [Vararia minispora EC-137]|uniref:Zinc knuckle-domain-containing protein n=1 Tax=Vararia minispora EC-137 TaxID=1314806 RepID=A0ACB8QS54_9AGAM|nr:zinc knuckle-domain-containing protein [Vararia minispora EC-137]
MSKFAPHFHSSNNPRPTSSTTCQKCLKTGHFTYQCKATTAPYVSRPSRTQQLEKPNILAKLRAEGKPSVDVPDEFRLKPGTADKILEAKEKEREKEKKSKEPSAKRRRRQRRSRSSDTSSSKSDNDSDSDSDSGSDSSSGSESRSDSDSDSSSASDSSSSSRRSRRRRIPRRGTSSEASGPQRLQRGRSGNTPRRR